MGLIDLKTEFRSLRYGNDRPGYGNSGQPYVSKRLPSDFLDPNSFSLSPVDNDFLLRGGVQSLERRAQDVSRLTQFFTDLKSPEGALFVAKQNALNLQSVPFKGAPGKLYNPASTLAQVGVQGSGVHFDRGGEFNIPDTEKYFYLTKNEDTQQNDLVGLFNRKIDNLAFDPVNVKIYQGGPGAPGGIGFTRIRFADQRTGINSRYNLDTWQIGRVNSSLGPVVVDYNQHLGASSFFNLSSEQLGFGPTSGNRQFAPSVYQSPLTNATSSTETPNVLRINTEKFRGTEVLHPDQQFDKTPVSKGGQLGNFVRDIIQQRNITDSNIISNSPSYNIGDNKTIEGRVNLGNPGRENKNLISYTRGTGEVVDKLNATPLYRSSQVNNEEPVNDLVKFRIAAIDNNDPSQKVFIHFRAFIDSFSDSYNPSWNTHKYAGRGESFYTYDGFTRAISMGFKVYAQSKGEIVEMYKKLNYLATNTMPDYSSAGYMRGPFVQFTMGGYIYEQPGFINNLSFTVPQQSTWEIGINDEGNIDNTVKELPHMMEVQLGFTPVHNFLPRKSTSHTNQNSKPISLSNGTDLY